MSINVMKHCNMPKPLSTFTLITVGLLFLVGCTNDKPEEIRVAQKALPEVIDFNFHVKPILSDKCFACHGPDKANQKADLRLDTSEGAFKALSEGGAAIVPGSLSKSQAFQRMISNDPELIMPPPESHLQLTTEEIATLAKWIEQGAAYKPHWSYLPMESASPPEVRDGEKVKNPIDNFILKRLEREGVTYSEEASKEMLIRRASFDLKGLPPGLDEIDDFVNDTSPDAYTKMLDRLMASSAYGERMAADWMDVARFADSDGYLDDKHRDFSPWRDWTIGAFNRNMPYDQFVTWQLAGDLIEKPTQESILATAFNRLNKRNSEAGIVFEEYRVEYAADRTNTLGKAFMGLSVECARCHDHKYDAISQKDYYKLFGFFNSTFEIGTPVYGPDQTPGPALLLSTEEQQEQIEFLNKTIEERENKLAQLKKNAGQTRDKSMVNVSKDMLDLGIKKSLKAHYPFDYFKNLENGKFETANLLDHTKPAKASQPIFKEGKNGNAFFVSDYNSITMGEKVGWYERTEPFSVQLWVRPDTLYGEAAVVWHSENLRLGLKGYSVTLRDNKVEFVMAHSWPQNAIQVTTKKALTPKEWFQLTFTYDGSSKASGVNVYIDGVRQPVTIDYDNLYKGILYEYDIHTYGFSSLQCGTRAKFVPFKNGGIDELKVFDRSLTSLEVLYTFDQNKALDFLAERTEESDAHLSEYITARFNKEIARLQDSLKVSRNEANALLNSIPEIMVMGDMPEPRPTYILERGLYSARGEEVEPGVPEAVMPFDEKLPKNRLGLARWLLDRKNPLTARVYVNRVWQMHFGKGLVSTSDDFGNQGSLPSHPQLLDWLALYFIDSGWDIKGLHKLIMTSAAYRQSSVITDDMLEKDPENILLARGPRFRLPAEMIRDNALAISGLLVDKIGGESVYPYQPPGLWEALSTKGWRYRYLQEPGEGLYRRSLYTIWKRTAPPPSMLIFDIADRGVCTVQRTTTSTPLQALVLLNDPQFVEASRVLAEGLLKEGLVLDKMLNKAFRMVTGRLPDEKEAHIIQDFYTKEYESFSQNSDDALAYLGVGEKEWDDSLDPAKLSALGVVVNGMMNTAEAYFRN